MLFLLFKLSNLKSVVYFIEIFFEVKFFLLDEEEFKWGVVKEL